MSDSDSKKSAAKFLHGEGVFVVAEIGKNFIQTEEDRSTEEYLENAKRLIAAAKEVGADAVKFQTHHVEDEQSNLDITSPHFSGSNRYNWVKRNTDATPLEFWQELKRYSDEVDIVFFSTPMSRKAARKLSLVDMPLWKVGSGDILDFVLLDYLASTKKPIIISSGMSTLEEIDRAVSFLKERTDDIVLLHCVSKYPCPPEDLNLGAIAFLKKRYGVSIGFSDHSLGYESAVAAVQLGAVVVEKHFSFDRELWGADHKVSLTPAEFKIMVEHIRAGEWVDVANYGEEVKVLQEDEMAFRPIFRKTLVAGRDIVAGTILTGESIYAMRPQAYIKGLPSEAYEYVVGKVVTANLKKYQPITDKVITIS